MSPTDPAFLLKQLEPAVRPAWLGAPATRPAAPLEHRPFDELLAQAKAGRLDSGRAVSAALEGEPLSPEQLQRLAAAADTAEASGARRALLMLDGRALVLDVPARTIAAELSAASGVEMLDAALYVPAEGETADTRPLGPPGGIPPRGVAHQLDEAGRGTPSAA